MSNAIEFDYPRIDPTAPLVTMKSPKRPKKTLALTAVECRLCHGFGYLDHLLTMGAGTNDRPAIAERLTCTQCDGSGGLS